MNQLKTSSKLSSFFRKLYKVWFPWLDIAILAFIYLFLWGERMNPYHQYQLIKNGVTAIGNVSGEDGIYQYSDHPLMRDFIYTFPLPNGKVVKSSAHTFTLDKVGWKKPSYPASTQILYLPNQPEINWIKADLSDTTSDFFYRHLTFGTSFIAMMYIIAMIPMRLSILEHREEKQAKLLDDQNRMFIELPKEL